MKLNAYNIRQLLVRTHAYDSKLRVSENGKFYCRAEDFKVLMTAAVVDALKSPEGEAELLEKIIGDVNPRLLGAPILMSQSDGLCGRLLFIAETPERDTLFMESFEL